MGVRHNTGNTKKGVPPILPKIIKDVENIYNVFDLKHETKNSTYQFLVVVDFSGRYEDYAFISKGLTEKFLINVNKKIDEVKFVDLACIYNIHSNTLYLQQGNYNATRYIIDMYDLKTVDHPISLECKSLFEFFTKSLH